MSDLVGNPDDGFSRDAAHILYYLKILQCLPNIIRGTNVLVHIMIRLQECTNSIDEQIGIVFVQDSCAVYGKNLESLEKKGMLCFGSEQLKCLLICTDRQTSLF